MNTILKNPITEKCAWLGTELKQREDWIHHLSDEALQQLDQALQQLHEKGLNAPHFSQQDFKIESAPVLAEFAAIMDEIENGYGFIVIRGLSKDKYNEQDLTDLYYGLGLYFGRPVTQNARGDYIGYVENVGDKNNKSTRVYETNSYLPYHTDLSDVVGLICIRKAKEGGLSSLVSAATVYNKILQHYPEYLSYYYHPAFCDHLGDEKPTLTPIFSYYDQKLSCRYMRAYIELGHERSGMPLSQVQKEALDIFDQFIQDPELRLDMMLEPGDMQFCNNYSVMHSRTGFEDYDELEKRRKLLRLWLKMPNARILSPEFPGRNGIAAKAA
ncbi:hypothetical protein BS636_10970 [Acinetobacter sp. LoGeW2-3]|uniref:TauD/TfdA family dioxygenase n=1 Tax=Acinetobacter sp. LoGeW2-3 TaxID=1808001 RepID=UPI000C0595F9|nr:TauD/TfdA family dioxygenase [Acinetobacter sp. LoGeW2-3]ATO20143.1 hypothetical protein BS636_10970 [Acinetobacter sp. LoGeW2-3]